jgi:hypothetical protein
MKKANKAILAHLKVKSLEPRRGNLTKEGKIEGQ